MLRPTQTHHLFGGAVQVAHFGTAAANFSPRRADWLTHHRAAADALGLDRQVRLKVDFSNVVGDAVEQVDDVVYQTVAVAEGYRLAAPRAGAAITSADCCTGVLWDGREAVAMHLGVGCVHRADATVIENALRGSGGEIWLGAAIGPCCYGFPERDDAERARVAAIRRRWGAAATPGRVRWGPRRGWAAIDHVLMAARHAESLGLSVRLERECTACRGLSDPDAPGYGDFYSNTRDEARGLERNLVVVARS